MRHGFERGEPKRFGTLGQRRINKEPRIAKHGCELSGIKNRTDKVYSAFRSRGSTLKRSRICFASAAKFRFGWADNHQSPICKSSPRAACEGIDQNMHPFLG